MCGYDLLLIFCGYFGLSVVGITCTGSTKSGCYDAIGIQTGFLEDRDIKTSSSQKNFTAYDAWCPSKSDEKQFFAVDLGEDFYLTKVATQGKEDSKDRYTKSYILQFSEDAKRWTSYKQAGGELIDGNENTYKVQSHDLTPPIIGRYVKLVPKSWNNDICTRMELYGCSLEDLNKKSSESKAIDKTEEKPKLPADEQHLLPQPEASADITSAPAPAPADPSVATPIQAPSQAPVQAEATQQNNTTLPADATDNKPTR